MMGVCIALGRCSDCGHMATNSLKASDGYIGNEYWSRCPACLVTGLGIGYVIAFSTPGTLMIWDERRPRRCLFRWLKTKIFEVKRDKKDVKTCVIGALLEA